MDVATTHKTFKYKVQPTPAQAAQLGATLRVCRELYNAALQERREAWKMAALIMTSAKPMAAATVNHGRIWVTAGRISPIPPNSSTPSDEAHQCGGHVVRESETAS